MREVARPAGQRGRRITVSGRQGTGLRVELGQAARGRLLPQHDHPLLRRPRDHRAGGAAGRGERRRRHPGGHLGQREAAAANCSMFEFFFPGTREFAAQVACEIVLIEPRVAGPTPTARRRVREELAELDLLVAHRVIGPLLEAYSVLADELALLGDLPADGDKLVKVCLGVAQQRWLQRQLTTAESVSADYFRNAVRLVDKLGLLDIRGARAGRTATGAGRRAARAHPAARHAAPDRPGRPASRCSSSAPRDPGSARHG